jgi:glutamine amidotransferase-like uncharacterized protein
MSMSIKKALVYFDEGCCYPSAIALCHQLKQILDPKVEVEKIDSSTLRKGDWKKNAVLLAMGGGECSQWERRLGKRGMRNIQEFASEGSVIALCAASYFLSSSSHFKLTNHPAMIKKRAFALFSGEARGPIIETEKYLAPDAARALEVSVQIGETARKGMLYYQGGCEFSMPEQSNAQIFAQHKERPVAVICSFGKRIDNVFLCGLHPEFAWPTSLKECSHPALKGLADTLCDQESFRQNWWQEIGKRLKLPMKSML